MANATRPSVRYRRESRDDSFSFSLLLPFSSPFFLSSLRLCVSVSRLRLRLRECRYPLVLINPIEIPVKISLFRGEFAFRRETKSPGRGRDRGLFHLPANKKGEKERERERERKKGTK